MANVDSFLASAYGEPNTSIQRDLHLNLKKVLEESPLEEQERYLNLLAIGTALHDHAMMDFATGVLKEQGLSDEMILEARESAAMMGMLNTYYKFKGYLDPAVLENYSRAGLRMQALMKPVNGKARWEQMAFSVSVINGCPTCVSSHEKALTQIGVTADKIHDLARMASVSKGLSMLKP